VSTFDSMKQKAAELAEKAKDKVTPEQVDQAVGVLGDKVDQLTKGKYTDKIDQAQAKVSDAAEKALQKEGPGAPPAGPTPTSAPPSAADDVVGGTPLGEPPAAPGSRPSSPPS
jgi:hypothetical protein